MENKLSFRKRIAKTKMEVFNKLQDIDLDKTANKRAGYYSLKSIMVSLNPVMDKYDIDIDINIGDDAVLISWIDCLSESIHTSTIDIKKIKGVPKLPSMTNEVQSYGAILSYIRRYSLTIALNLNATDILEQGNLQQPQKPQKTQQQKFKPTMKSNPTINEEQRKLLFAKMKEANITSDDMHITITKLFQKISIPDLTTEELNIVLKRIENKKKKAS